MRRRARDVYSVRPQHLTQRAIRRQPMFNSDDDRRKYLSILKQEKEAFDIKVLAYCLMDNQVNLVLVPYGEPSNLSRGMRNVHARYSRYFNTRNGYIGNLLQGRFLSCPMDDASIWNTIRYVERCPAVAGIVNHPSEYQWSSAAFHCGIVAKNPLLDDPLPEYGRVDNWHAWLAEPHQFRRPKAPGQHRQNRELRLLAHP